MNRYLKKILPVVFLVLIFTFMLGFMVGKGNDEEPIPGNTTENVTVIDENGTYTSKEDVALYIYTYGKLPSNFVTKNKAKDLGWVASKNNLQDVCEGCSIGGDSFGNREGLLPKKDGRKYYECDIDYHGGARNEKRIVFSNDGLVYYTDDHYNSYTLLYGEP